MTLTIAIDEERFDVVESLLTKLFFHAAGGPGREGAAVSFGALNPSIRVIHDYYEIKGQRLLEPQGEFIKEQLANSAVTLQQVMQTDLILYLRARVTQQAYWWPHTLIHAWGQHGPFEVFARAQSKSYFDRIKGLIGVANVTALKSAVDAASARSNDGLTWQHVRISISTLVNYEHIGTQP